LILFCNAREFQKHRRQVCWWDGEQIVNIRIKLWQCVHVGTHPDFRMTNGSDLSFGNAGSLPSGIFCE